MTEPATAERPNSLLVGLPPEVQGLIFDHLTRFDLKRLCLTCKTVNAVALPKLYDNLTIKVPQRWARLPSLENLLGSTGDGLKYTTEFCIDIQQNPLRDSQKQSEDSRLREEVRAEQELQFYLPQSTASNALNTLVRLLILKLPQNHLRVFDWEHCCELDVATLYLLFERQKASLRTLSCKRYSSACDLKTTMMEGIRQLSVRGMDLDRGGCRWAAVMIVENAKILKHLGLGFTTLIAHDFALKRRPRYNEMSTSFTDNMQIRLSETNLDPLIHLSLESLSLCGLDIGSVIRGEMGLDIDLNSITKLRLESCPGLNEAFSLLTGQGNSPKLALGPLQDLFVRTEDPDPNFPSALETFLISIRGLKYLEVLVDKALAAQNLEPVLKIHGKTLKKLVWDERTGPRTSLSESTSLFYPKLFNLYIIAKYCPSLTTLGTPLDWEAISKSQKHHKRIWQYFRLFPYLEALNIRNLPKLSGDVAMPMPNFVKGLAAMFVDVLNRQPRSIFFKTIAVGAPFYKDTNIGTFHVAETAVNELIRFRVYKIDYDFPSPVGLTPVLTQIVTGARNLTEEVLYPAHLLDGYWLG